MKIFHYCHYFTIYDISILVFYLLAFLVDVAMFCCMLQPKQICYSGPHSPDNIEFHLLYANVSPRVGVRVCVCASYWKRMQFGLLQKKVDILPSCLPTYLPTYVYGNVNGVYVCESGAPLSRRSMANIVCLLSSSVCRHELFSSRLLAPS